MTADASLFDRASEAAEHVRRLCGDVPQVAVVLGSGLGPFADSLEDRVVVPYDAVPHWPRPAVIGHPGRLTIGETAGRRVLALAGRTHLYEGRPLEDVVFAVRVLGRLGVRAVVLTNAAGGINTNFEPGELMLIDDHINLTGCNPLVGPNDDRFGVRFPDMSDVYSPALRQIARDAAGAAGLRLRHGVYIGVSGPSYETPAEIRAFRALGADAVGMSTVHEAIVARHMGIEVLGISCISNLAAGILPQPLTADEVLETVGRARSEVLLLLGGVLARL